MIDVRADLDPAAVHDKLAASHIHLCGQAVVPLVGIALDHAAVHDERTGAYIHARGAIAVGRAIPEIKLSRLRIADNGAAIHGEYALIHTDDAGENGSVAVGAVTALVFIQRAAVEPQIGAISDAASADDDARISVAFQLHARNDAATREGRIALPPFRVHRARARIGYHQRHTAAIDFQPRFIIERRAA